MKNRFLDLQANEVKNGLSVSGRDNSSDDADASDFFRMLSAYTAIWSTRDGRRGRQPNRHTRQAARTRVAGRYPETAHSMCDSQLSALGCDSIHNPYPQKQISPAF